MFITKDMMLGRLSVKQTLHESEFNSSDNKSPRPPTYWNMRASSDEAALNRKI
jgi:hypothetical protein